MQILIIFVIYYNILYLRNSYYEYINISTRQFEKSFGILC